MLAAPAEAARGFETTKLAGLKVLLVEDDNDSRQLLCELLVELGATCISAGSGQQALALFAQARPDVLVSDLWMDDGDGFELIRTIRSLPSERGGLTPAIAVSAASNTEEALMAGYHLLIAKPFDPFTLADAIEEFSESDDAEPSARASWTATSPQEGTVVVTFVGNVSASDMSACAKVLLGHLEAHPCEVVVNFRQLMGISVAAASALERGLWPMRHALRRVRVVGGPSAAKRVVAGACRVLGVACTTEAN